MPITKGAGNPKWSWDETLLALDLLYRHGSPLDRKHGDVIALSELLRSAQIHAIEGRKPSFRNPDGVALKMQNLMSAIDPHRGLSSSKTDRKAVKEFPQASAQILAVIASQISEAIDAGEDRDFSLGDEEHFTEGQLLTSRHRRRESKLRKKLLGNLSDEELVCEVCAFAPPALDRRLRESFFEVHHVVPLSQFKGLTATRVRDLALLCAGCHRFLHKLTVLEKRWISVAEAREKRTTISMLAPGDRSP